MTATTVLLGTLALAGWAAGPGAGASGPSPMEPPAASPVGSWQGVLRVTGAELRLVFHIRAADGGGHSATMDSPDQGANGIPVQQVTIAGDSITLSIPAIQARYVGAIAADGQRIDGTFTQGGQSFPLPLERREDVEAPKRPQIPERPYPYDEEEVTFVNEEAGVTLAGTFTKPRGAGPFPAVALVTGSGPQDRDETVAGHPVFLVLADHLTRQGIAVLRYDDRGVGRSTGSFGAATSQDFASDAAAAVEWLDDRADVDLIGVVGHSEGGLIAPIVATRTDDVDFIVMLAGPGMTGEEIILAQAALIARAEGAPEAAIAKGAAHSREMYRVLREEPDDGAAREKLRVLMRDYLEALTPEERRQAGLPEEGGEQALQQQVVGLVSPWFRHFLTYDPRTALRRVDVPVLALNGALDLQVPAEDNIAAIEAALREAGNDDVTTRILPRLNHLFQTAETGSPTEYARIEQTFDPAAMDLVAQWIKERTR